MARIVIALGGNALGNTPAEQQQKIEAACPALVGLISQGHEIIISHGNGPQVGMINLAFDIASGANEKVAAMPLQECTAMSQGYIGYHLQKGIARELRLQKMPWQVATVVTQVVVDENDPAFKNPTKPIGAFYDEETAKAMMAADPALHMAEDSGRGWRRFVPSPKPVDIAERKSILNLLDNEYIVIACGGGGIPVCENNDGRLQGVDAVIDKDFASELLAEKLNADALIILTAVEKVAIRFGKPDQQWLDHLTPEQARQYEAEGHFAAGSMLPKVRAAVQFAESAPGRTALITLLEKAREGIAGKTGTSVCQ